MTSGGASLKPAVRSCTIQLCARRDTFLRGDANADGAKDISDAIALLGFMFIHVPDHLVCKKSGDVDDTGYLDITDGIRLINNLFLGGPVPMPPYPACGVDETEDDLPCDTHPACAGP